jgi:large subunit ribosomal protein L15
MATLNQLKRPSSLKRVYRRRGRGQSSSRGKTSGRGTKGQNARAGRKKRPELRDIIKKLPKLRGHGKNRGRTYVPRPAPVIVSLDRLEKLFDSGTEISYKTLVEKGVLSSRGDVRVKIVSVQGGSASGRGQGTITKKLTLVGVSVSGSAKAAIEKAGGNIKL